MKENKDLIIASVMFGSITTLLLVAIFVAAVEQM
tara:strand:- start:2098 stop:2199 length:102 start_codon:yes stop_codon:yes gene_type:complete